MPFRPGISGNPNGRPKGAGHRQQVLNEFVLPHKKDLIEKALIMAKEGDPQMLKLFLERILPAKPLEEPINIDLPDDISKGSSILPMSEKIFRALENQDITPEQARTLLGSVKEHRENIGIGDFDKRLTELEIKLGRGKATSMHEEKKN